MKLWCVVGFHAWNGCECSRCGKLRDEGHDWTADCQECAVCHKKRPDAHVWSEDKCSRCGIRAPRYREDKVKDYYGYGEEIALVWIDAKTREEAVSKLDVPETHSICDETVSTSEDEPRWYTWYFLLCKSNGRAFWHRRLEQIQHAIQEDPLVQFTEVPREKHIRELDRIHEQAPWLGPLIPGSLAVSAALSLAEKLQVSARSGEMKRTYELYNLSTAQVEELSRVMAHVLMIKARDGQRAEQEDNV
jgi:hypothetical protein